MILWDTTPLRDLIADVLRRANEIYAAINWEALPLSQKDRLQEVKAQLKNEIDLVETRAHCGFSEDRLVGHYVDVEGGKRDVGLALFHFKSSVRELFPYQEIKDTNLSNLLYDAEYRYQTILMSILRIKVTEVMRKEELICAAINWDELSPLQKRKLQEAKTQLRNNIEIAENKVCLLPLPSEGCMVGHYVDVEGGKRDVDLALSYFISSVREIFPYREVKYSKLSRLIYAGW